MSGNNPTSLDKHAAKANLQFAEDDEIRFEQLRARLKQGRNSPIVENISAEQFLAEMHTKYLK